MMPEEKLQMQDTVQFGVGKTLQEGLTLKGWVRFEHRDRDGNMKAEFTVDNIITNTGKAEAAGLFSGVTSGTFGWIALGTGTNAAVAGDTALQTEITTNGGARAATTNSRVTTTVTNDTAQFYKLFTFTGSLAITESGVFDASSTGVMLCRQTCSAINVVSTDTLAVTWKVKQA